MWGHFFARTYLPIVEIFRKDSEMLNHATVKKNSNAYGSILANSKVSSLVTADEIYCYCL